MSVVEGLRNIGKLNVQTKGYDFASYTHHICSNEKVFLKRYRWCSTMKIIEVTNEIVVNIDLANAIDCRSKKQEKINERLKFQNLALVKTIELESLMEIAYRDNNQESRHIDDDKMNYWVGLLLELRGLIRKWRESTLKGDC